MGKSKEGPAYEPPPEEAPPDEDSDQVREAEMEEKKRLRQKYGKSQTIVGGAMNRSGGATIQKPYLGGS